MNTGTKASWWRSTGVSPVVTCSGTLWCGRRGFTLTEVLIVIGIIVLVLAMAVPALNFMTGSNSVAAAQNNVSAMLGRARAEALYTGQTVGVAFYMDQASQRVTMALVQYVDSQAAPNVIDVIPDRDVQTLQPGTGAELLNNPNAAYPGNYTSIGDTSGSGTGSRIGVIMFNAMGHVASLPYSVIQNYTDAATVVHPIQLYQRAGLSGPIPSSGPAPMSVPGLVLYERGPYENASNKEQYLSENGLVLIINRYNGTLFQSE